MTLLVTLLAACGGGNDDDETPTVQPQPTQDAPTETAVTELPTLVATPGTPVALPVSSPVASPVASPAASPAASPVASPVGIGIPVGAAPEASERELTGTVSLPGTANEDFLLTDDGCVGLGEFAGVAVGQQVVVRDETGTIVGVTRLMGSDDGISCTWRFSLAVPDASFYEVELPAVTEHVFTADEIEDGPVELELR
jgi:hypothetical protein